MDDESLVVELEIVGFALAYSQIMAYAKAVGSIGQPWRNSNALVVQHGQKVAAITGPYSRLMRAQQQYNQAVASGMNLFDAHYNLQKAQAGYNKASQGNQANPMQALKNWVYSMRFGYGSGGLGVHPLIGRTFQMITSSGPMGLALAGIAALGAAAKAAADSVLGMRNSSIVTGSSMEQVQQGRVLSNALGLDENSASNAARAFAQELSSGGWAQSMFAGKGISDPMGGGPYGNKNQMKQLFDGLNALRHASKSEQLELIRSSDTMRQFAGVVDMTDDEFKKLRKSAELALPSETDIRAAREFNTEWASASNFFMSGLRYLGIGVLWLVNSFIQWIQSVADWIDNLIPGKPGMAQGAHSKEEQERARALNHNTEALHVNTGTMKQIFGGGERAGGAMPSRLRGTAFNEGMKNNAVRLGAFSI